jgi:hypothetical protein
LGMIWVNRYHRNSPTAAHTRIKLSRSRGPMLRSKCLQCDRERDQNQPVTGMIHAFMISSTFRRQSEPSKYPS